jgi:hypothetical protein
MDYELPYPVLDKLTDKLRMHKAMERDHDAGLKKLKDIARK